MIMLKIEILTVILEFKQQLQRLRPETSFFFHLKLVFANDATPTSAA